MDNKYRLLQKIKALAEQGIGGETKTINNEIIDIEKSRKMAMFQNGMSDETPLIQIEGQR